MALTEEQRLQVEANMGLIGKVLKDKLRGSSALGVYTHEDLFQIGCVGLRTSCAGAPRWESILTKICFRSAVSVCARQLPRIKRPAASPPSPIV